MSVSIYDACLVVVHREIIHQTEENPIGLWLIQQFDGVWVFLFLKALGTIVACSLLCTLFRNHKRIGLTVALAVAALQLVLVIYLNT